MAEKDENNSSATGNGGGRTTATSFEIKVGLAEMLKGGVIMDVTNPEQAKIAEEAGAAAVRRTSARTAASLACARSR